MAGRLFHIGTVGALVAKAALYYIVRLSLEFLMSDRGLAPKHANKLDATGIGLSVICVGHCLFLPVAAAASPVLAPGLAEVIGVGHEWHLLMLLVAAPVSLIALGWGARVTHGGRRIWMLGLIGLGLMALGATHLFGHLAETVLTLIGVTVLAFAHFSNWRARAKSGHDHARDCEICDESPAE